MKFTFNKDGTLNCLSDSGSNYTITAISCNCKGFQFRKICKHYNEAKNNGLIDKLKNQQEIPDIKVSKNNSIITARKIAIEQFLKNHKIKSYPFFVDKLEKKLTNKIDINQFLQIIKKYSKNYEK